MKYFFRHIAVLLLCSVMLGIDGCTSPENQSELSEAIQSDAIEAEEYPDSSPFDAEPKEQEIDQEPSLDRSSDTGDLDIPDDSEKLSYSEPAPSDLAIVQDIRPSFSHRLKSAEYQKYIVLHDTEGDSDPASVIDWWDSNGNLVAAHFVIGKDGSISQCVPLDEIAHHAGYGDTGHNEKYGLIEDGRDDMEGSSPIGSWASDYGMNAWSVCIELVHRGGEGDYPAAQLEALDGLIAYIDSYYGFESEIIDHKAWRSGNSDTSEEFSAYLENYQDHRRHN